MVMFMFMLSPRARIRHCTVRGGAWKTSASLRCWPGWTSAALRSQVGGAMAGMPCMGLATIYYLVHTIENFPPLSFPTKLLASHSLHRLYNTVAPSCPPRSGRSESRIRSSRFRISTLRHLLCVVLRALLHTIFRFFVFGHAQPFAPGRGCLHSSIVYNIILKCPPRLDHACAWTALEMRSHHALPRRSAFVHSEATPHRAQSFRHVFAVCCSSMEVSMYIASCLDPP